jgi:hypothetical protein
MQTYFAAPDFSLDGVPCGMATQILISISITTACIPALKPFLDSFASGALSVQLKRGDSGNTYELHSRGRDTKPPCSPNFATNSRGDRDRISYVADVTSQNDQLHPSPSFDTGNSDELIIKRTDQWKVTTSVEP